MTEPRLELLAVQAPAWFSVEPGANPTELVGVARPPETIWSDAGLPLRITPDDDRLAVSERVLGTHLPERCFERHIQNDHTFCLGLDATPVTSRHEADVWWAQLAQWLVLQSIAALTGRWPAANALDHGDAGEFHRAAVALAADLGIDEEYMRAHAGERSWISDPALHIADAEGRPLNGRLPCPRGCRTTGRRPGPRLRRDCPHRQAIARLVAAEAHRRRELALFWAQARAGGRQCCGTMVDCPLRAPPPSSPVPPLRKTRVPLTARLGG